MWIRLLKKVDDHNVNDFLDVEESVARGYVAAGFAIEDKDGPEAYLLAEARKSFVDEFRKAMADATGVITEASRGLAKRPRIDVTLDEADKTKNDGDFIRQIWLSSNADFDADTRGAATERLGKVYGSSRVMAEGQGATGGFTTNEDFQARVFAEEAEEEIILSGAENVPMGSRETSWPALDQFSAPAAGQSAMFGGIQVARKTELSQRQYTQPAWKRIKLVAEDLTAFAPITRDLLADNIVGLSAMVPRLFGGAIGWRCDWEALNGTGSGMGLGILNAPCTIFVTRNTGGTIKYADVYNMYVRLLPRSKKKAAWLIHPFQVAALVGMVDGSGRLIYVPTYPGTAVGTVGGTVPMSLFGLPVIESEKMAAPGSTGDFMLVDRSKILHGRREGLEIGMSDHFFFDTDEVALRAKVRNDIQPWLKKAIYLADGSQSNQVSCFVVLQ